MRAALLLVAGAAAVCAAAVPAIVGMTGNTSFSHHIPVRVPVGASAPHLATDDSGATSSRPGTPPDRSSASGEPSIEDSHGPRRHSGSSESSEHGTGGTDDRIHHRGRGRDDSGGGATSTDRGSPRGGPDDHATHDKGSGRGRGGSSGSGSSGGGSGSGSSGSGSGSDGSSDGGRRGDDHSGRG